MNRDCLLRNFIGASNHVILRTVIGVVLNHAFQVGHVERLEKFLHADLLLIELYEKLLSMAAGLRTRPSANMLLDPLPFFAIHF